MSKLGVNIGNTHIKLGYLDPSGALISATYLPEELTGVGSFFWGLKITEIVVASVVPQLTQQVIDALVALTGARVKMLTHQDLSLDMTAYDTRLVGIDRLLACQAVINQSPQDQGGKIIFDLGTATTVNVLDRHQHFLGGAILAGAKMNLYALGAKGAQLPEISLEAVGAISSAIGHNTKDGIIAGLVYGTAGTVMGMAQQIQGELGYPCQCWLTGGFAPYILPHLKGKYVHNPHLVIEGILSC